MARIIFITIVSIVYFLLHYFVYKSLAHSLTLSSSVRFWIKLGFWICGVSFLVAMTISRVWGVHFLNMFAFIWLGIIAISFWFFIFQRITAFFMPNHKELLAIVTLVIIGLVSVYSVFNGLRTPVIRNLTIPVKNLPQEFEGFKVVMMADNHLEGFKSKGRVKKTVEIVNSLNPDLVLIAGDLVDPGALGEPIFCEELKKIKSKHGVMVAPGNHEFYTGMQAFRELSKCANIKVLDNTFTTIGETLQIVGLQDDQGRQFLDNGGPDIDKAMDGCDPTKPTIMLYHRPFLFDEGIERGVDLLLAGHTHAGQIPPMEAIVWLYYKYPYGLYEKDGAHIYTTSGVGFWGPPMRFLVKPEIVEIKLTNKK